MRPHLARAEDYVMRDVSEIHDLTLPLDNGSPCSLYRWDHSLLVTNNSLILLSFITSWLRAWYLSRPQPLDEPSNVGLDHELS